MADLGATAAPPAKPSAPAAPATDPKAGAAPAGGAPPANPEATEVVKINGKEYRLTKAQLIAAAQKGMFADQKLKSVDALQKGTAGLLADLKTPEGLVRVLKNPALGANPKEVFKALMASDVIDDELKETMSKWVYDNVVAQAKKTPEQIENEKKLSEYERLKKAEEERKQKEATAAEQAKIKQIYAGVRAEVSKQIVADKTFPQTEGSIRQVVEKLRVMNKKGVTITPENIGKALQLVKKDHVLHQQALFDAVGEDPEALISLFGEARALKISRALVARHKLKGAKKAAPVESDEAPRREKTTEAIDRRLGRTPQGYKVMDI
jgi:hypothetical protein